MNIITALGGIRATAFLAWAITVTVLLGFQTIRLANEFAAHSATIASHALASNAAVTRAREAEKAHQIAMNTLASDYEKERENERIKSEAIITKYRTGMYRLRDRFTKVCGSDSATTSSTSTSGDDSKRSGLSKEDVEFLIRESARADRNTLQLKACQAVVLSYYTKGCKFDPE